MTEKVEKKALVLPLKDIAIFPQTIANIFVGRESSKKAVKLATKFNKLIVLVPQINPNTTEISLENLYKTATIGRIANCIDLPDGTIKMLVGGLYRIKVEHYFYEQEFLHCSFEVQTETGLKDKKLSSLHDYLLDLVDEYIRTNPKINEDTFKAIDSEKPVNNIDLVAANCPFSLKDKIQILETNNVVERCKIVTKLLKKVLETALLEIQINDSVKQNIDKSHREFYLNEKMKAIKKELGEEGENELELLKKQIEEVDLSPEALEKSLKEYKKLSQMSPQSPEYGVVRNYLDTLLNLPWNKRSELNFDIIEAETSLNRDHYGLEEVKERILEQLAVQQRVKKNNGSIICLVGPPGVGKTSLAESIAQATKREYIRMALGGVRDEAEIRGHRRTYIGSMPGKIIQKIMQSKTKNPLFLLDEVDKMSMDFRGDPASALLEVLDPEQNHSFSDHYLEVDFDLSEVMFIATSNSYNIPTPLLDRMEIIELSGYTDIEKRHIARDYLIPKQKRKNGVKVNEMRLNRNSISTLISRYTREAGVRSLERQIAKLCRKIIRLSLSKKEKLPITLNNEKIEELLGASPFQYSAARKKNRVGQITGLAWNQVGGDILTIETAIFPGTGKLVNTGKLGEVMQESIKTAFSVVKSYHQQLNIPSSCFKEQDIHLHIPEGATPKDGPSAGVAITCVLASIFNNNAILSDFAITGEITLSGEVLAIGGLKQKLLAAKRSGIKKVLIPEDNKRHLNEISKDITDGLNIIPIRQIEEAFQHAFVKPLPQPTLFKKNISSKVFADKTVN